jgi:hypothetical protein
MMLMESKRGCMALIKQSLGLVCVLALVAGCAGSTSGSKDADSGSSREPIVISQRVNDHLQEYLKKVQRGRAGAFAVNELGTSSFYATCTSGMCGGQYNFSEEALAGCRKYNRGNCIVLSSNGVTKRPYKVGDPVDAFLSQLQQKSNPQFVSGDRIRQEISGNSTVETDVEGRIWAEYFAPDGVLHGRTSDGRLFDGTWKVDGDRLCVDYHSIARDWCGQFAEASDGSIDYYVDGKFRKNYSRSMLQKGNPQHL